MSIREIILTDSETGKRIRYSATDSFVALLFFILFIFCIIWLYDTLFSSRKET